MRTTIGTLIQKFELRAPLTTVVLAATFLAGGNTAIADAEQDHAGHGNNAPAKLVQLVRDATRQFINVIISLLSEEDGQRPLFIDDWSKFRPRTLLDWGAKIGSLLGFIPNISYQIIGGASRARGSRRGSARRNGRPTT